jgi:(p)ppGpp synthase/HD superfamily hydrolase
MDKLNKAIEFAITAHSGQYRKGIKIPYITHCFEVMKRTSYYTEDEDILCIAMLHDTLEDCDVSYKSLKKEFGKRVADGVQECTRNEGDNANKLEKYQFLESFSEKSMDSVLVKIADRYCNVLDYRTAPSKENDSYYSKYAVQAFPLMKTYTLRQDEIKHYGDCVQSDIMQLQDWIMETYPSIFNLTPMTIEEKVKQIVL